MVISGVAAGVTAAAAGVTTTLNVVDAIRRNAESSISLRELLSNMDKAKEMLVALRVDRELRYKQQSETMSKTEEYNSWYKHTEDLEEDVRSLKEKHDKVKRKLKGFRDPFFKLTEAMKRKTGEALNLHQRVFQGDMFVPKVPERVVLWKPKSVEDYPTLQEPLELILAHLQNARIKCVAVHGKLGVGKTTIMKNLNDRAGSELAAMFDLVVWVNASNKIMDMQRQIAYRLKIDIKSENDFEYRIRDRLKGMKYLLLLDGVDEVLNVEGIGIYVNEASNAKIVLTTRSTDKFQEQVNEFVEIPPLTTEEAKEMLEDVLDDRSGTLKGMRAIIDYSCGLPYRIEKLGNILKLSRGTGSDLLKRLTEFRTRGDDKDKELHKLLEIFCDQLQSRERECFLYSTIYPGDSDIDENRLFDCWTAEALCDQREDARKILDGLKMKSYLQEGSSGGEYVRMEKNVWDVALKKLLDDPERAHLVKARKSSQNPPLQDEDWNDKVRISLVNNDLRDLPGCPVSPQLFTLFLQNNRSLNRIPHTFFKNMGKLRVLNFENTGIVSVPHSLGELGDLKVFYLNDCTGSVTLPAKIRNLSSLEVLDIRGARVTIELPLSKKFSGLFSWSMSGQWASLANIGPLNRLKHMSGQWASLANIGPLNRLKRLLVSFSAFGNGNASQDVSPFCEAIFSISPTLEELVIDVNSAKKLCYEMMNDVRNGVAPLKNLKFLKFVFKDGAEAVIKVVAKDDLERFSDPEPFEVYIGCSISSHQIPNINKYRKYLKICSAQGPNTATSISQVLSRCDAFELVNQGHLEHLSQFGGASFNEVKGCLIEGCDDIQAIADGGDPTILAMATPMLPELQELYMKNLPKLESIWKGQWKADSLVNLRILLIKNCTGIVELLSNPPIPSYLPSLKKLILIDLQNLTTLCTDSSALEWPALEELEIRGCENLTRLPFKINTALNLTSITALQSWWDRLTWQDPNVKIRLDQLYYPI